MCEEGGKIMDDEGTLSTEIQFFNKNRQEWFEHHAGKIALIRGTTLYGFYDNFENAYEVGVNVWGDVDFLMKEVQLEDRQLMLF